MVKKTDDLQLEELFEEDLVKSIDNNLNSLGTEQVKDILDNDVADEDIDNAKELDLDEIDNEQQNHDNNGDVNIDELINSSTDNYDDNERLSAQKDIDNAPSLDDSVHDDNEQFDGESNIIVVDDEDDDNYQSNDSINNSFDSEELVNDVVEFDNITVPDWAVGVPTKLMASVAHAFLLHGNIHDYMVRDVSISEGIIRMLDPVLTTYQVIATYDVAHGLDFTCKGIVSDKRAKEYHDNFSQMIKNVSDGKVTSIPSNACDLFELVSRIMIIGNEESPNLLLFVENTELLIPDGSPLQMKDSEKRLTVILSELTRSYEADEHGSAIVFYTDNLEQVSSSFRDTSTRTDTIEIPIPRFQQRLDFIQNILDIPTRTLSDGSLPLHSRQGVSPKQLATNTAGLAYYQIEDIVLRAIADDMPVTLQLVKERKSEIIKNDYNDVLEIMDPQFGFDGLGGLDNVKRFFKEEVIEPIHKRDFASVPMGILLMGAAGVAKTALSKAVAYESQMNCVSLNINHIFDKYVGQSERNLDRALDCALSMAPTIIFIDEIDEALPKRHTGEISGLNNRINKRLLEFFSDTTHRGEVIILAATNYPDKIDAAFKRAGRFDQRIPMFAPGDYDRIQIFEVISKRAKALMSNGETGHYHCSSLRNPYLTINNPYKNITKWIENGNHVMPDNYKGKKMPYEFYKINQINQRQKCVVEIPLVIHNIIDKPQITLREFYETKKFLFDTNDYPKRENNLATFEIEDDTTYYNRIKAYLNQPDKQELFDNNPQIIDEVFKHIQYYDKRYNIFFKHTNKMTGAELEVVLQKAINLFRRWSTKNQTKKETFIKQGKLQDELDIPWAFIKEACIKTTNSTASVKSMEDKALLDTSDIDFIPDATYGIDNSGNEITYMARLETLRLASENFDQN